MSISIHALLAESDLDYTPVVDVRRAFLSTLSLRRATAFHRQALCFSVDFYPRSPCGERRKPTALHLAGAPISIHALLAESDYSTSSSGCACSNFYPRSPCGERLSNNSRHYFRPHFYPRSPCGERHRRSEKYPAGRHFYPRSPCGERHTGQPVRGLPSYFYPRSPCGERPRKVFSAYGGYPISIHALLAESDHWEYWVGGYGTAFLSTLSLRRATPDPVTGHWPHWVFLSTLSLRRATTKKRRWENLR